jgi:predicted transcriptional regulator
MVTKYETLSTVEQLADACTAGEMADELGIELSEAALSLLRSYRAGLLFRWRSLGRSTGRHAYHYWLTQAGEQKLLWLEQAHHSPPEPSEDTDSDIWEDE